MKLNLNWIFIRNWWNWLTTVARSNNINPKYQRAKFLFQLDPYFHCHPELNPIRRRNSSWPLNFRRSESFVSHCYRNATSRRSILANSMTFATCPASRYIWPGLVIRDLHVSSFLATRCIAVCRLASRVSEIIRACSWLVNVPGRTPREFLFPRQRGKERRQREERLGNDEENIKAKSAVTRGAQLAEWSYAPASDTMD